MHIARGANSLIIDLCAVSIFPEAGRRSVEALEGGDAGPEELVLCCNSEHRRACGRWSTSISA